MAQSSIASISKINHNFNSNPPTNTFKYVNNFKYNYSPSGDILNINQLANEYEKITNITPTNFKFKDNQQIVNVTILSDKETIHIHK